MDESTLTLYEARIQDMPHGSWQAEQTKALVAEVRRLQASLKWEMERGDDLEERMNAAFGERDDQYHETRRFRDALEWYAEPGRWARKFTSDGGGLHYFVHDDIEDDLGERARIALAREIAPESGENKTNG